MIIVEHRQFSVVGDDGERTQELAQVFNDVIDEIEECEDMEECAKGKSWTFNTKYGPMTVRTTVDGNNVFNFVGSYTRSNGKRGGLIYKVPVNNRYL